MSRRRDQEFLQKDLASFLERSSGTEGGANILTKDIAPFPEWTSWMEGGAIIFNNKA